VVGEKLFGHSVDVRHVRYQLWISSAVCLALGSEKADNHWLISWWRYIELNYNVMAHAQKTIFVHGRRDEFMFSYSRYDGCCQLMVSALEQLINRLIHSCCPVSLPLPLLRAGLCYHITIEL
jgi:hypothetical protein